MKLKQKQTNKNGSQKEKEREILVEIITKNILKIIKNNIIKEAAKIEIFPEAIILLHFTGCNLSLLISKISFKIYVAEDIKQNDKKTRIVLKSNKSSLKDKEKIRGINTIIFLSQ